MCEDDENWNISELESQEQASYCILNTASYRWTILIYWISMNASQTLLIAVSFIYVPLVSIMMKGLTDLSSCAYTVFS